MNDFKVFRILQVQELIKDGVLRYNGDVRNIWKELDEDESGIVAFEEVAPEEYEVLLEFKHALRQHYVSAKEAWTKLLDLEHEFNIDVNEFTSRVPNVGIKKGLKKLFKLVIPEKGGKYIHIEDIEWVPAWLHLRR